MLTTAEIFEMWGEENEPKASLISSPPRSSRRARPVGRKPFKSDHAVQRKRCGPTKFVKHGITIVGLVVADVWRKQQTVKAIDLSWKDRLVANPRNAFPQLPTKDVEVHFICFVFSGIFTWDVVISTPVPTVLGPSNGCTSQQAGRVKSHLAWSQLMLFLWRNWWS